MRAGLGASDFRHWYEQGFLVAVVVQETAVSLFGGTFHLHAARCIVDGVVNQTADGRRYTSKEVMALMMSVPPFVVQNVILVQSGSNMLTYSGG